MKITNLEDEILALLQPGELSSLNEKYSAHELYQYSALAADKKEVCTALNAMVKRGEIVRDKDELYSVADKKAPDVVLENSETKKEEPVLDLIDRHVKALNLLDGTGPAVKEVINIVTRLANDPEFRKFAVAYGKSGNAHSK